MGFAVSLVAVCLLSGFPGFPKKIKGEVVVNLKNYITISVKNKKKTEFIEITFPKKKCKILKK